MLAPHAELRTSTYVVFFGPRRRRLVVDANIQHVHPSVVLAIVTTYIGTSSTGLDHDRDTVKFGVSWVKHVA